MKRWDELSDAAKAAMEDLGNAGPTVRVEERMVKGYRRDEEGSYKLYRNSGELRMLAAGMREVADWLDERANA